ncbi:hypothetical protein COB52_00405 [Candidatus Kaiserbacteria bacterium]|nr:MAG: hypothetical protein COB52_00405 [Candidatus Kaiserbacteria bacterium]
MKRCYEKIALSHYFTLTEMILNDSTMNDLEITNDIHVLTTGYIKSDDTKYDSETMQKFVNLVELTILKNKLDVFEDIMRRFTLDFFTSEQFSNFIYKTISMHRPKFFSYLLYTCDNFKDWAIEKARYMYNEEFVLYDNDFIRLKMFPDIIYSEIDLKKAIDMSDTKTIEYIIRQGQYDMDKWLMYAVEINSVDAVSAIKQCCNHHTVFKHEIEYTKNDTSIASSSTCADYTFENSSDYSSDDSTISPYPPYLSLEPIDSFDDGFSDKYDTDKYDSDNSWNAFVDDDNENTETILKTQMYANPYM